MNAPAVTSSAEAARRRARRAAIATRLLAGGSPALARVDWAALDQAPDWLALPADELDRLQARLGVMVRIAEVRLWIDRARLEAVRVAVGEGWLRQMLCDPMAAANGLSARDADPIESAAMVVPRLCVGGAAVLAAGLSGDALRQAALAALGAPSAAPINPGLAGALIMRAMS